MDDVICAVGLPAGVVAGEVEADKERALDDVEPNIAEMAGLEAELVVVGRGETEVRLPARKSAAEADGRLRGEGRQHWRLPSDDGAIAPWEPGAGRRLQELIIWDV